MVQVMVTSFIAVKSKQRGSERQILRERERENWIEWMIKKRKKISEGATL